MRSAEATRSGRGFILRRRLLSVPDQSIRMPRLELHVVFDELIRIVIELGGDPAPNRSDFIDHWITSLLLRYRCLP
jgi:hypothetical protein